MMMAVDTETQACAAHEHLYAPPALPSPVAARPSKRERRPEETPYTHTAASSWESGVTQPAAAPAPVTHPQPSLCLDMPMQLTFGLGFSLGRQSSGSAGSPLRSWAPGTPPRRALSAPQSPPLKHHYLPSSLSAGSASLPASPARVVGGGSSVSRAPRGSSSRRKSWGASNASSFNSEAAAVTNRSQ